MITALALIALALVLLPVALGLANLTAWRPLLRSAPASDTLISILIPARNEALNIGDAVAAARASGGVALEILVMDDGSTDGTAAIVQRHAADDPRVRLLPAPPLPPGWAGKAHACQRLAEAARGTHLLFADADVRLQPHAAAALAAYATRAELPFVSAMPRQLTNTLGELLTVPMINLLLLGYLPMRLMRRLPLPSLAAATGQLMLIDRAAYHAAGGHAAIRATTHDGLKLARRFRDTGRRTDLVYGADLATCRMYDGFAEAWSGFSRNAREGMASWTALPIWTLLLLGGHVLPFLVLLAALGQGGTSLRLALVASTLSLALRAAVTGLARERWLAVPLHPATVAVSVALQWNALLRGGPARATSWKGRVHHAG